MTGRRPDIPRPDDSLPPAAWSIQYRPGTFPDEFNKVDEFSFEDSPSFDPDDRATHAKPWEAPGAYAVFATYLDEFGNRREIPGADFIIYQRIAEQGITEGTFIGGGRDDVADRMVDGESIAVFAGKWIADENFERVRQSARHDRRFPASLDDRDGVIAELEAAAADTGKNRYDVIMQAIYRARNLGYPQSPFIDDIVEDALYAAMQARRGR
jgi:hypothetical protein